MWGVNVGINLRRETDDVIVLWPVQHPAGYITLRYLGKKVNKIILCHD